MFYVIILKTDTPNKTHAVHLTKLKAKFRQKAVFKSFLKKHADSPKEYFVESLEKGGKPKNFYSKKAALSMVHKQAEANGYFVRLPQNTWGVYNKIQKVRKQPPNEQYEVTPIPVEYLRDFVVKSIEDYSSIDQAAQLMFKREIPVFSMKTRMLGVYILFKYTIFMKNKLMEEALERWEYWNKKRGFCNPDHSGNVAHWQSVSFRVGDYEDRFWSKKKTVNEICARLTKLYSKTPGSRAHTVDAVEPEDIKTTQVIKVI